MKRLHKLALRSSLALLLAAITTAALAAAHGPGFGPGPGRLGGPGPCHGPEAGFGEGFWAGRMVERLGLSDEQRDRIRAIHEGYRDAAEPLMETLKSARQELGEQIHADLFDETAIRASAGRVAAAEADLAVLRARIASDVHQVLTPEQLAEARELRERMHDFAGDRHGGHGRWGRHGPHGLPSDGE